jgi:hypothetical protein
MRGAGVAIVACLALLGVALGGFFGLRALVFSQEDQAGHVREAPGGDLEKILEQGRQATWLAAEKRLEKAKEATALDNAKPRFKGQMGDFMVGQTNEWPQCPLATQWVDDLDAIKASELYSPALGENVEAAACADGTIIGVFVEERAGRFYFVGPPGVPYEAPLERLRLLTVGGKPAIAEIPIPDNFVSDARLMVIQRFPTGQEPGIAIGVDIMNDLDGAIKLAERIMGVAP